MVGMCFGKGINADFRERSERTDWGIISVILETVSCVKMTHNTTSPFSVTCHPRIGVERGTCT